MFKNRIPKTLAEKGLVAYEHIGRAHFSRLQVAHKSFSLGEGAHLIQKFGQT